MEKQKNPVLYGCVIVAAILYLWWANQIATQNLQAFHNQEAASVRAVVTQVVHRSPEEAQGGGVMILFEAEIRSGLYKGDVVNAMQRSDPLMPVQVKEVAAGDRILLAPIPGSTTGIDWYLSDYLRSDALLVLGVLFAAAVIFFGRRQGVNTLLSLGFTCAAIFLGLVPAILSGRNIYFWVVLTCVFITLVTLLLVYGTTQKSLAAALGCLSGVLAAALLTLIMSNILGLTGLVDEDSVYLLLLNDTTPIDLKAIIFAAILIGALGAIMDVAIDIASALQELSLHAAQPTPRLLFRSGLTIGRDIIGTMSNTLVLAYIGGSLSVVLLLAAYSPSLFALLNQEMIVVEILQALIGSFGILLSIPCTAGICSLLMGRSTPGETDTKERTQDLYEPIRMVADQTEEDPEEEFIEEELLRSLETEDPRDPSAE